MSLSKPTIAFRLMWFNEVLVLPFQGLAIFLPSPLFIFLLRDECGIQAEGLLQAGVEVGAVVHMKFKAIDCHVKPGLCLGVWGEKKERNKKERES